VSNDAAEMTGTEAVLEGDVDGEFDELLLPHAVTSRAPPTKTAPSDAAFVILNSFRLHVL
jgi:hypothetical protein